MRDYEVRWLSVLYYYRMRYVQPSFSPSSSSNANFQLLDSSMDTHKLFSRSHGLHVARLVPVLVRAGEDTGSSLMFENTLQEQSTGPS